MLICGLLRNQTLFRGSSTVGWTPQFQCVNGKFLRTVTSLQVLHMYCLTREKYIWEGGRGAEELNVSRRRADTRIKERDMYANCTMQRNDSNIQLGKIQFTYCLPDESTWKFVGKSNYTSPSVGFSRLRPGRSPRGRPRGSHPVRRTFRDRGPRKFLQIFRVNFCKQCHGPLPSNAKY